MSKPIGRNDPCPCQSGKKYKKCCLLTEPLVQRPAHLLRNVDASMLHELEVERSHHPNPTSDAWFAWHHITALANDFLEDGIDSGFDTFENVAKAGMLTDSYVAFHAVLATWKLTKGTYRFDPSLREALLATPLSGRIPVEILLRLPEWCVYIETPHLLTPQGHTIEGFFATLIQHASHIDLLLTLDSIQSDAYHPLSGLGLERICLREDRFIEDSVLEEIQLIKDAVESRPSNSPENPYALLPLRSGLSPEEFTLDGHDLTTDTANKTQTIKSLLSLVLYLCADEREINDIDGAPKIERILRETIPPQDKPINWLVGVRLGKIIRAHTAQIQTTHSERRATHSRRARMRPHTRAAHWQTFWYGPRKDPSQRTRRIRWVHVSFVNLKTTTDLPVSVNEVLA